MQPVEFRFIWPSSFRKRFLEIELPETRNCLWRPCLLKDRDEVSNLYRGSSIDAYDQDSVHFGRAVSEKIFRN